MILQPSEQVGEVVVMEGSEYVLLGSMVPIVGLDHGEVAMALDPWVNGNVDDLHPDLVNLETVEYTQKSGESEKWGLYKEQSVFVFRKFH